MSVFSQVSVGEMTAVITDAFVFEAKDVNTGVPLANRYYTQNAAWDTGAEVTIISPRVVKA